MASPAFVTLLHVVRFWRPSLRIAKTLNLSSGLFKKVGKTVCLTFLNAFAGWDLASDFGSLAQSINKVLSHLQPLK
jgi:hypothetical protein